MIDTNNQESELPAMNHTFTARAFGALTAAAVAGLLIASAPTAHADKSCTFDSNSLHLNNNEWRTESMWVEVHGTQIGPGAHTEETSLPNAVTYGTVSDYHFTPGGYFDLHINWNDNKGRASFAGQVDENGFVHGTASGPVLPVNLWHPGMWSSFQKEATCTEGGNQLPADQKSTATVTEDVDVYESVGPDGGLNNRGILRGGNKVQLLAPCKKKDWCNVSGDAVPTGSGWVWGALDF